MLNCIVLQVLILNFYTVFLVENIIGSYLFRSIFIALKGELLHMTYEDALKKEPKELLNWLVKNFSVAIPEQVNSAEDMVLASSKLLELSSKYSYLCNLASYAKIVCRDYKRNKDKQEYEDMVDKKEIIGYMSDSVKQSYQALSRAVTIYIHNLEELKMLGHS